jgi:RNA polymerase sigma factor (TIGR02999 family)
VAAQAMRRVLVDHARRRSAAKRGDDAVVLSFDEELVPGLAPDLDLLALDQALDALAELDRRQSRIVELRFFGGLTIDETAAALGVSPATVKNDWQMARAWLFIRLRGS